MSLCLGHLPSFLPALAQQQYLIFQEILIEVPLLGATVQASGAAQHSSWVLLEARNHITGLCLVPSGQFKDASEFPEDQ